MELRHDRENAKMEMNGKEAEKPKPMLSRKAPLVAGLVAATALALGACSVRDEKPVENKKGVLVAETKPETKKAEVFMSEVEVPVETKTTTQMVKEGDSIPLAEAGPAAISLKVTKISKEGVELALEVETAFEQEGYFEHWMTVPYGKTFRTGEAALAWEVKAEKGKKPGEAVVTVKTTAPKEDENAATECSEDLLACDTRSYSRTVSVEPGDEVFIHWPAELNGTDLPLYQIDINGVDKKGITIGPDFSSRKDIKIPYGESRFFSGPGGLHVEIEAINFPFLGEKDGRQLNITQTFPCISE